jgi:type II secretory pathway component PulC
MGLMAGDIVQGINQEPTPDPASFTKAADRVKLSDGVVLDILRQGRPLYISYTKP